jgi:hypothetical protein
MRRQTRGRHRQKRGHNQLQHTHVRAISQLVSLIDIDRAVVEDAILLVEACIFQLRRRGIRENIRRRCLYLRPLPSRERAWKMSQHVLMGEGVASQKPPSEAAPLTHSCLLKHRAVLSRGGERANSASARPRGDPGQQNKATGKQTDA